MCLSVCICVYVCNSFLTTYSSLAVQIINMASPYTSLTVQIINMASPYSSLALPLLLHLSTRFTLSFGGPEKSIEILCYPVTVLISQLYHWKHHFLSPTLFLIICVCNWEAPFYTGISPTLFITVCECNWEAPFCTDIYLQLSFL